MNYITTTDLRTQSSNLISTLKKGGIVKLIHRSKIVGIISPKKEPKILTAKDVMQLKKLAKELNLPKISYQDREEIYRKGLAKKYGKDIS